MTFADIRKTRPVKVIYFLSLPFLVLFWLAPVKNGYSISNDYPSFPIREQMALLYSIAKHSFPLFMPGYWRGQTASALTLGQLYHPLSWIAYFTPGYWNGSALLIDTALRMLSLGVAQFALYALFRRLQATMPWAFLCSFIAVYNLRMLDLFRYGASLENYTGFLLTCAFLGYLWLEPHKPRYFLLLALSMYGMLCGGHPQMAYFGILGSILFTLFCPFISTAMLGQPRPSPRALAGYYARCLACFVVALGLAAAYAMPFYFDFMKTNSQRVDQGYAYSLAFGGENETIHDTFNNFLLPFRPDVHGNFSGSSLIVMALLMPLFSMLLPRCRKLLLALWGVGLVTFLYMLGERCFVHHLAWQFLPFAHSFRMPGRLSLYLPMLIAVMLLLFWKTGVRNNVLLSWLLLVMACVYLGYGLWTIHFQNNHFFMSPVIIRNISKDTQAYVQIVGFFSLVMLALWTRWPHACMLGLLTCLLVALHVTSVLYYGTWIQKSMPMESLADLDAQTKTTLYPPDSQNFGMDAHDVHTYEHYLRSHHTSCRDLTAYKDPALAVLTTNMQAVDSRGAFFDNFDRFCTSHITAIEMPEEFLPAASPSPLQASIHLTYASFNRLVFEASASRTAYAIFSHPFSPHWNVLVNGLPAAIYRANGLYLAVPLPPGHSRIALSYWSFAQYIGMGISCFTLLLLWLGMSYAGLTGVARYASMLAGLLVVASLFGLWRYSLYHGTNFGTQYVWETPAPPKT